MNAARVATELNAIAGQAVRYRNDCEGVVGATAQRARFDVLADRVRALELEVRGKVDAHAQLLQAAQEALADMERMDARLLVGQPLPGCERGTVVRLRAAIANAKGEA